MLTDLDSLLAEAELEAGTPLQFVAAWYPEAQVSAEIHARASRPPRWSEAELDFVRQNIGFLSVEEIGRKMGRSPLGIKIAQVRNGLPAASRRPGWLTGQQVATLLGIDVHTVCVLTDSGMLPHAVLPGERRIRAIRYITLLRWAVNPLHWIYFKRSVDDPQRILDSKLRRLIERQKQRWTDEWWTPVQVAEYHGVEHTDVNRVMRQGKMRGVRWGNWWFLRSEAMRPGLRFFKGKGNTEAQLGDDWSEESEAFLIQARAEGQMFKVIARKMKMPLRKVQQQYHLLKKRGQFDLLVSKFGLEVGDGQ